MARVSISSGVALEVSFSPASRKGPRRKTRLASALALFFSTFSLDQSPTAAVRLETQASK